MPLQVLLYFLRCVVLGTVQQQHGVLPELRVLAFQLIHQVGYEQFHYVRIVIHLEQRYEGITKVVHGRYHTYSRVHLVAQHRVRGPVLLPFLPLK